MAAIANQNGRRMVQHVLLPVNIHFHWNILIFEFLTIYFDFWIFNNLFWFFEFLHWQPFWNGGHFVLPIPIFLAYLLPLDVDVTGNSNAKICEVWSELNIFCILVTMATAAILNFFNPPPPKSCHTLQWIFLQSFMKFDERNPNFF
jgi:hypothetical protein